MEKKLELIQQLAKAIARNALMVEHTVDVQLKAGQWNGWEEEAVLRATTSIDDDLARIIKELKEL